MLTRIRNSSLVKHQTTEIPATKMTRSIAKVLQSEGFIGEVSESGEGIECKLVLTLKYKGKTRSANSFGQWTMKHLIDRSRKNKQVSGHSSSSDSLRLVTTILNKRLCAIHQAPLPAMGLPTEKVLFTVIPQLVQDVM